MDPRLGPAKIEPQRDRIFRFGQYELSVRSGELRKSGVRLHLQEQPLRVLLALLERPSDLVTREQLRQQIWAADTFVDFDRGLNTAISKLRLVLGDDAANPRYIETQSRRGYRFIAPVTLVAHEGESTRMKSPEFRPDAVATGVAAGSERAAVKSGAAPGASAFAAWWKWPTVGASGLLLLGVAVAAWLAAIHRPAQITYAVSSLTTYPGLEYSPALAPDGNKVAFSWTGPDSKNTFAIYVKQIGEEQATKITDPLEASDGAPEWTPDGRYILFVRRGSEAPGIYSVPAVGGTIRRLVTLHLHGGQVRQRGFSVAPDGNSLVYCDAAPDQTYPSLFLLDLQTLASIPLTHAGPQSAGDGDPGFSPDGRWIAFERQTSTFQQVFLLPAKGGEARQITFENHDPIDGLAWSDDGRYLLLGGEKLRMVAAFGNDRTFMVIPGLPETVLNPAVRGARLVYARGSWSANIWRLSLDKQGHASSVPAPLITSTREQAAASFSPDGKQIAFQSNRSGFWEIWKCRGDGSNAIQLTFLKAPLTGTPRWSPDGQWIAFDTQSNGNGQIFVTSADGGVPRMLTPEVSNEVVPNWSRDGKLVYFSSDRTGAMNLWRVPAAGGTEQQITRNGGMYPVESFDGSRIYYSKSGTDATLWTVPANGGVEEPVRGAPVPDNPSHWALARTGIYVMDSGADLVLYEFATGKTRKLYHDPDFLTDWSMALSPDGGELLWAQIDNTQCDLVLVDNFHPATQAAILANPRESSRSK